MIFTKNELHALKAFYADVPARQIRAQGVNPWPLLAKHRNLPTDQYEAVRASLARLADHDDASAPEAPRPADGQPIEVLP